MIDPGFIYLAQSGEDYRFKIGRTVNLPRRMRSLQLGSPTPLHLVAWHRTPDPVAHEKQWHKNLGISRRHGEWFDLNLKQLRLFEEFSTIFSRLNRIACPMDSDDSYYVSFGSGEIIEVAIVDIEFTDQPWSLLQVEGVATLGSGDGEQALLYLPHMKKQTHPEVSFEVCSDCISTDPRGAMLNRVMEDHTYSKVDMDLHELCEKEMGHRHGQFSF